MRLLRFFLFFFVFFFRCDDVSMCDYAQRQLLWLRYIHARRLRLADVFTAAEQALLLSEARQRGVQIFFDMRGCAAATPVPCGPPTAPSTGAGGARPAHTVPSSALPAFASSAVPSSSSSALRRSAVPVASSPA